MLSEQGRISGQLYRSKDVRKTMANLEKKGYKFEHENFVNNRTNKTETWTKVISPSTGKLLDFNWSVGRDKYDDKETHVWSMLK